MSQDTVTIPKTELEKLKKSSIVDHVLVAKLRRAFEDIKHGRVTEWKER